jgi:hypothetical protein
MFLSLEFIVWNKFDFASIYTLQARKWIRIIKSLQSTKPNFSCGLDETIKEYILLSCQEIFPYVHSKLTRKFLIMLGLLQTAKQSALQSILTTHRAYRISTSSTCSNELSIEYGVCVCSMFEILH